MKKEKNVRCLVLHENTGGAGGFYCGMKQAAERGYDAVWIMDDDTIPCEDALYCLLTGWEQACAFGESKKAGGIGYVSSRVEWTDGTLCKMNLQHFLKTPPKDMSCTDEGICPIDRATFVSLLFPAKTIRRIGLPMKEYFIWGDDKEYTLRAAAQFPCYYIANSVVVHKMSGNTGSNITFDEIGRIPRYFYAYRNDFATARSRGTRELAVYFAAFVLNQCRILFCRTDHKKERIAVMWRGVLAGLNSPTHFFAGEEDENVTEKKR